MSEAPKRIHAAATRWAIGHGPDIDWRSGNWSLKNKMAVSQEYVRADIVGGLLDALEANGAWLERWAQHVGNCVGGDACTCGLTLARHENVTAIAKAKGEQS